MIIIKIKPNRNGTHSAASCNEALEPPDGWAVIPGELEENAKKLLPFVKLTMRKGKITGISDNPEAREAMAVKRDEHQRKKAEMMVERGAR